MPLAFRGLVLEEDKMRLFKKRDRSVGQVEAGSLSTLEQDVWVKTVDINQTITTT